MASTGIGNKDADIYYNLYGTSKDAGRFPGSTAAPPAAEEAKKKPLQAEVVKEEPKKFQLDQNASVTTTSPRLIGALQQQGYTGVPTAGQSAIYQQYTYGNRTEYVRPGREKQSQFYQEVVRPKMEDYVREAARAGEQRQEASVAVVSPTQTTQFAPLMQQATGPAASQIFLEKERAANISRQMQATPEKYLVSAARNFTESSGLLPAYTSVQGPKLFGRGPMTDIVENVKLAGRNPPEYFSIAVKEFAGGAIVGGAGLLSNPESLLTGPLQIATSAEARGQLKTELAARPSGFAGSLVAQSDVIGGVVRVGGKIVTGLKTKIPKPSIEVTFRGTQTPEGYGIPGRTAQLADLNKPIDSLFTVEEVVTRDSKTSQISFTISRGDVNVPGAGQQGLSFKNLYSKKPDNLLTGSIPATGTSEVIARGTVTLTEAKGGVAGQLNYFGVGPSGKVVNQGFFLLKTEEGVILRTSGTSRGADIILGQQRTIGKGMTILDASKQEVAYVPKTGGPLEEGNAVTSLVNVVDTQPTKDYPFSTTVRGRVKTDLTTTDVLITSGKRQLVSSRGSELGVFKGFVDEKGAVNPVYKPGGEYARTTEVYSTTSFISSRVVEPPAGSGIVVMKFTEQGGGTSRFTGPGLGIPKGANRPLTQLRYTRGVAKSDFDLFYGNKVPKQLDLFKQNLAQNVPRQPFSGFRSPPVNKPLGPIPDAPANPMVGLRAFFREGISPKAQVRAGMRANRLSLAEAESAVSSGISSLFAEDISRSPPPVKQPSAPSSIRVNPFIKAIGTGGFLGTASATGQTVRQATRQSQGLRSVRETGLAQAIESGSASFGKSIFGQGQDRGKREENILKQDFGLDTITSQRQEQQSFQSQRQQQEQKTGLGSLLKTQLLEQFEYPRTPFIFFAGGGFGDESPRRTPKRFPKRKKKRARSFYTLPRADPISLERTAAALFRSGKNPALAANPRATPENIAAFKRVRARDVVNRIFPTEQQLQARRKKRKLL